MLLIDHAQCLELAAEMLGGPVRALVLDWELETVLRRRLRLEKSALKPTFIRDNRLSDIEQRMPTRANRRA